ncbi:MAG: response regulator [Candidatus Eisenbacteria bacterium]|nr:response regulator [Candidatus Eisenbacteria bacterium]
MERPNTPASDPAARGAVTRLLLVDDEPDFRGDLIALLEGAPESTYRIAEAGSAEGAREALARERPDLILLDVDLGRGASGLDLLLEIRRDPSAPPVIMLTGDQRIGTAVTAIRRGAYNYLTKPPRIDELQSAIQRAAGDARLHRRLHSLQEDLAGLHGEIVAHDPAMLALLRETDKVAPTEATVLITGESGTGKELIARRIHQRSSRSEGPFVAVNCGAIPSELIESELFGHEKGAFTGAADQRVGKFELARGGTLLLDEIGDSPALLQVKLLRALEERSFARVGGTATIHADVRVLAATSRDLEEQIRRGDLREELYYRLNVFRLHLPPLRERPGDILPLAMYYAQHFATRMGRRIEALTPAAQDALGTHAWPGNIRELRNTIERAVIRCERGELDLPDLFSGSGAEPPVALPYDEAKEQVLRAFKRDYLIAQLRATEGNVTAAAERSGLKRQSLQRMLQECGVDAGRYRRGA